MNDTQLRQLQSDLKRLGFYAGAIDGAWGPASAQALSDALARVSPRPSPAPEPSGLPSGAPGALPWGKSVSPKFRERVWWMQDALRMPSLGAGWLMASMAWETDETFSPSIKNRAGSGATGLIQFMPTTAVALGTTTDSLARLSAEDQLNFVYKYFKPYAGRLNSLGDVYMAILWPKAIGAPDTSPLWTSADRPTTYRQNAGLDLDRDGVITKAEAVAKVKEKLRRGLLPEFVFEG